MGAGKRCCSCLAVAQACRWRPAARAYFALTPAAAGNSTLPAPRCPPSGPARVLPGAGRSRQRDCGRGGVSSIVPPRTWWHGHAQPVHGSRPRGLWCKPCLQADGVAPALPCAAHPPSLATHHLLFSLQQRGGVQPRRPVCHPVPGGAAAVGRRRSGARVSGAGWHRSPYACCRGNGDVRGSGSNLD